MKRVCVLLGTLLIGMNVICFNAYSAETIAANQAMPDRIIQTAPGAWMVYGWVWIIDAIGGTGEALMTVQKVLGGNVPLDTVVRVNGIKIEKFAPQQPDSPMVSYKGKVSVKPGEEVTVSVVSQNNNLSFQSTTAYNGLGPDVNKIFVNTGISSGLSKGNDAETLMDATGAVKLRVLEEHTIIGGLRTRTYDHTQITTPGDILVNRVGEGPGSYFVAVVIDDAQGNPLVKWACSFPSSPVPCLPYSFSVPASAKVATVISKELEVEVFYNNGSQD